MPNLILKLLALILSAGVAVPALAQDAPVSPAAPAARDGSRDVWLPEAAGFVAVPVYARDRLAPGNRIPGPAIVEQMDSTTLVLPGMTARVDGYDNLILEAAS